MYSAASTMSYYNTITASHVDVERCGPHNHDLPHVLFVYSLKLSAPPPSLPPARSLPEVPFSLPQSLRGAM